MSDYIQISGSLRRVCMLSSSVVSLLAITFDFLKPLEITLGLTVDLTEKKKQTCQKQLEIALECAIEEAEKSARTYPQKKIWNELLQTINIPADLSQLIKDTEAYQELYCTDLDAKEMILIFEKIFKEEVVKHEELSRLFILSANTITLENLKRIENMLQSVVEKVESTNSKISSIEKVQKNFESICKKCLNEMVFILIAMAVFLGGGIFVFRHYNMQIVYTALISYIISDFLIFYLKQENKPLKWAEYKSNGFKFVSNERANMIIKKIVMDIAIPVITTISIFWLIMFATNTVDLLQQTIALIIGNLVSIFLRNSAINDTNKTIL